MLFLPNYYRKGMEDFDPFQSSYQNAAMQRGNEYEPFAREEYERIYGETVQQVGWVELDNGFIGISPDGWIQEKKNLSKLNVQVQKHM